MFLKKFDIISPPITLFFKGDNMHSSIFSGVLTIIVYILIFISGIHYALEFIYKKNPTAFFINRFVDDAGTFPLNASSIFHYIQFTSTSDKGISPINFDMVRIIGIQDITIDNYPYINLENIPHWLYGFCNNNSDTQNIGYLITSESFSQSACIRSYYDNIKKKYYDTNNNNFKWPTIDHGMSSSNSTYYGIIVEKCKNDNLRSLSGKESCENSEKIDNYIFSNVISIYLIDHYSDVLNYNEPFRKYLYSVSNMLFPNYFTVNNMNFNPSMIKTHNGIIFDNTVKELSYFFSQNEKVTMDEVIDVIDDQGNIVYDDNGDKIFQSTGIVSSYYFWMQNRLQYYERNYKKLQDILSDIGGLSRVVLLGAIFINTLVSNYIILLDTEDLSLSLDQTQKQKQHFKRISQSPTIYRKINLLINPPKRQYLYNRNTNSSNLQQSSNIHRFMKEDFDIYNNTHIKNERIEKIEYTKRNIFVNKYNENNNEKNEIDNNNIEEIKIEENPKNNYYKRRYKLKDKINKFTESNDINQLSNRSNQLKEKEQSYELPYEKQNFIWFSYFIYMINCQRNNPIISSYEGLRAKIISEESIIKNHLELNKLLNYLKKKNIYDGNEII